jgi:uncharacterized membrane protein
MAFTAKQMRTNMIAGFLILLPLFASILILVKLFKLLDSWAYFAIPHAWRAHVVPGMGIVAILFLAWFTGSLARNFLGRKMMGFGNAVLRRIPLFNKLYGLIKQIVDAVASPKKKVFNRVVLIEFPEKGSYSLAFVTTKENAEISSKTGEKMIGVFMPQALNPTTGFLIFMPESKVIDVQISIEMAFKLIVSGGVVSGDKKGHKEEGPEEPLTLSSLGRLFKARRKPFPDPRD